MPDTAEKVTEVPAEETLTPAGVVVLGSAVKALGNYKVGGYLVLFSDSETPDLTGEYFDGSTRFGKATSTPVYYNHGQDPDLGLKELENPALLSRDETGVWIEHQLEVRDDYERAIYRLAEQGKLGWSSGTAPHLVQREQAGKAVHIVRWPLGLDASYTPTPAEPRTQAVPLKSIAQELPAPEAAAPKAAGEPEVTVVDTPTEEADNLEVKTMDETEVQSVVRETVKTMWEEIRKDEPLTPKVGHVVDSADRALAGNPWKSFGEMAMAVKAAGKGAPKDERLLPLRGTDGYCIPAFKAATGLGEDAGNIGGFLVGTDRASRLVERNWGVGAILSRISLDTISANSNGMTYYAENETSRVTGNRHGGVRGYWVQEGSAKTPSQPAFREMNLRLRKACALVYTTDELLADASALESYLMRVYPEELMWLVEDGIVRGTGAGTPLGILAAPALVTVAIEAGQLNTTLVAENLINMWSRRYTGVSDYVWLLNQDCIPQLYEMELPAGGGGSLVFMPPGGISGNQYGTIFGRPVIESEYTSTLGTVGDVILFSPSQYQGIQKGGVESASSIHFDFDNDQTVFRFVYRFDGQPLWNSAVTPRSASANTISPFVTLAGRP